MPKTSTRLAGHALPHEGRLHTSDAPPWSPRRPRTGPARCECGATSPELHSDNARKKWHREHKDEIRAQAT